MDLDARRLLLLRAVAQAGSLTAAAQALGLTTSAVSQQVGKLEREAGVALLERHSRGIRPTQAGEVLIEHAARIDDVVAAAAADMEAFAGLRRGELRLGSFPTAGATIVPLVVLELRRRHPEIALSIASARRAGLLAALRRHDVDLALAWDYEWDPLVAHDITVEQIAADPTVLLLPRDHRLADRPSVDVADLADEDWIVREEHPVASVLDRVCHTAGFAPRVVLSANDYQEVQGMVAAGLGVSLAPLLAVLTPRADVTVTWLVGNPAERRILLARSTSRRIPPAARATMPLFVESCAALLGPRSH